MGEGVGIPTEFINRDFSPGFQISGRGPSLFVEKPVWRFSVRLAMGMGK
jgi:hypothetical protein